MRYLRLLAAATLVVSLGSPVEAQTSRPVPDVVVAPFIVEPSNDVALRAAADKCLDQFVAALKLKEVAFVRDPQLSEKNLRSTPAPWAVLGRTSQEEGQFRLELRLLEVKSGDEMRSYFNSDKDPQVACRAVGKVAERIAAFLKEQKG